MNMAQLPAIGLDDRVAVVTGAARGMGAAHARTLAARGANLIMVDLDEAELKAAADDVQTESGQRVVPLTLDITASDAGEIIAGLAEQSFGRLDILVHNAGIMHDWKTLAGTPPESLDRYHAVNVRAPYAITRACVPLLKASPAARIVFISSTWGQLPDGHSYGYMVSKAAQIGLMKALSKELIADHILVNTVAPGAVNTRMVPAEVRDIELAAVPLGRLGEPEEIAAAVAFLASDSAGFISGQILSVNGGALINTA